MQSDHDGEETVDRRFKPALRALLHDQRALFDASTADGFEYDLRTGFPTRRELVEWYQLATVRTLGHLAEGSWEPTDIASDDTLLAALLHDGPRDGHPLPAEASNTYTRVLEGETVQPACNEAYRDLRAGAGEYIDVEPDADESLGPEDLNPEEQEFVAMRPGFQVLDREQQHTLTALWGGFDSETGLRDWLHSLNRPTNGEVDTDLAGKTLTDSVAMDFLVYDRHTPAAREWRELFAIVELLPAFAAGVQSVNAGELAARKTTGHHTLQMSGGVSNQ